ncbi:MAG TPA: cytochrome P450 [Allosphingosinicella sp.]|nr:cytochrome P450 [Allosphingosinicella sp.]
MALARECHFLVQRHARGIDFEAHVTRLGPRSRWPEAGNALILAIMRPALAASERSAEFHAALDRLVAARILSRHCRPASLVRRIIDRFRLFRAFSREAEARPAGTVDDIFDAVLRSGGALDEEAQLQLYAGFVFAIVGSVGFAFGWSAILAVLHGRTDHGRPAHLVSEALRLYPVAWLLERRTLGREEILGEKVGPADTISISPYAIHRNPAYWDRPTEFIPERWQGKGDRSAWLPFGAGNHSCVAATLTLEMVSLLLDATFRRPVAIEMGQSGPSIGAALAPPPFTLIR